MPNIEITNVDRGSVVVDAHPYERTDAELTFGGSGTVKAGTILALDSSTQKHIVFVKDGSTNGNGIPRAVTTYDVVATGSGNVPCRVLVSGHVNLGRLIIGAQGDGSQIDENVIAGLRASSINPVAVQQLSALDNQ